MINHFTFNGTSTAQLGLIVSGVSIFGAGSRKVEKAGIPGRNGDLQIELGGFNNYTVRYTVSITKNFTTTAQQIREWLLESKGYCDLTDTYHPDEIRKACFNSDIEFTTSMLYKYGQASIQFDCLPERYLTTNTPITTTATADTTTDTTMSLSTVPTPINISLNGNTTQEGSSGKNLIPRPYHQADGTYQGVTWATDNNGKITGSGTTTAGTNFQLTDNSNFTLRAGTYTLSITGTLTGIDLKVYNGSAIIRTIVRGTTNGHTTFTLSSAVGIRIYFNTGNTGDSVNVSAYVQLEKGSTATAYEPHISPTNPQTIHNVSGDNTVNVISKNIFDYEEVTNKGVIDDNGTVSTYNTRLFSGKIAVLPNTTYTFKTSAYSQNNERIYINRFIYYGKDGSFLRRDATYNTLSEATFTIPSDVYFLVIDLRTQALTTALNNSLLDGNTQLEKGSSRTTYEPYTRQSYPLYLPVENLIPNGTTTTSNGITFTVNADGSVLVNGTATNTAWFVVNMPSDKFKVGEYYTFGAMPKGADTNTINGFIGGLMSSNQWGQETSKTIQATTVNSPQFVIRVTSGTTVNNMLFYPQLEKGSQANHYTPYGTTPIELNKIGTYQDYIYKNGGKWYVHKETGKVDLGTLTWNLYTGGSNINVFYATGLTTLKINSSNTAYCTAYICQAWTALGTRTEDTLEIHPTLPYIYIADSSISTARDFQTAMNGVIFCYVLRTSTNTEITDTTLINQLNNIEKAYSYNGTTNILQVSNDNGFMLGVVSLHGSTFNSNYKGEPIITVNSTGLIYLNGEVMEVLSAPVTINCQTMQCYNGVVNMNNEVRVNDFPEIKIGANEVGSSMALTITPNNWRH